MRLRVAEDPKAYEEWLAYQRHAMQLVEPGLRERLAGHCWARPSRRPRRSPVIHSRNLSKNPVGIAEVEFFAPVHRRFGIREIALQRLESRVDGEVLHTDAKVMHLRLPELEEC